MELRWVALLAVSLICLAAVPTAPAASASSLRIAYDGAAATTHSSPALECDGTTLQRLGVVCAAVPKNARVMAFLVDDASKLPVGGTYYLYDASGAYAGSGTHCGARDIGVAHAALAVIRLEAANGPIVCAAEGKTTQGLATRGVVAIEFA